MKRSTLLLSFAAMFVAGQLAAAPVEEREVASSRVLMKDVVPGVSGEAASIDLGPTPLPGSSRLIKRAEIASLLPDGTKAKIPDAVRVVRKTRQLGAAELEKLATTALGHVAFKKGVAVTVARPKGASSVPAGFDRAKVDVSRPPRKEGKHTLIAVLSLLEGEELLAKVPLTVDVTVSKEGATPDAKKSDKGTLVVKRGLVEIRAGVSVGEDADVGDVVLVTIGTSNKVVKARLASAGPHIFEEVP